jgi:hypothetical protein
VAAEEDKLHSLTEFPEQASQRLQDLALVITQIVMLLSVLLLATVYLTVDGHLQHRPWVAEAALQAHNTATVVRGFSEMEMMTVRDQQLRKPSQVRQ